MTDEMTVACLILAGGRSRRMGQDKRTLHYEGQSFLNRALEIARYASDEVWVLVGSFSEYDELRADFAHNANVAVDRIPNAGPMSALAGALPHLSVSVDVALLFSVDYPLLSPAFLRGMIERYASTKPHPKVLLPESDGHWHVTCAIYATSLHRPLVREVDQGERSLRRWVASMPDSDVDILPKATWSRWASNDVLTNVNTPDDYRRLRPGPSHPTDPEGDRPA